MSAIPYEHRDEEEWDHYSNQDVDDQLPGRQRRRFFTRGSAALVALMIAAIGFYAGVHVEKAHTGSSTGSGSSLPAAAGRRRAVTRRRVGIGVARRSCQGSVRSAEQTRRSGR